jgi:4'-phosphopantetheinyl transferase
MSKLNTFNSVIHVIYIPETVNIPKNYYEVLSKEKKIIKNLPKRQKTVRILSDLLTKYIIYNTININEGTCIRYGRNGKPYIENSNVHFNLSHSGDYIACILNENPIGIDIQKILDINIINLANRLFNEKEINLLLNTPEEQRKRLFYKLWTLKESYIKMKGHTLLKIKSVSVNLQDDISTFFFDKRYEPNVHGYTWEIDNNNILSICTKNQIRPQVSINNITVNDILNFF